MRNSWLVSVIAICLLCPLAFAENPSAVEQTLIDLQKSLAQANVKKDAAFVDKNVADDFVQVGTNGDTSGKHDFVDEARDSDITNTILYNFRLVSLNDNAAVLTYDAVVHHTKQNEGARRYQRVSSAWSKQDGEWKLKFQQLTPNLWSAEDID
jgi:hypothetical protein